ncbi:D-alanyl-D-alanine endopeptidase [Massilia sp. W12]|uniref:D-alanyl-D-alanine endopeptidase n=1 Tax=Massilia sp. W12 TaxID=3126507 RepID=UPI0030CFAD77
MKRFLMPFLTAILASLLATPPVEAKQQSQKKTVVKIKPGAQGKNGKVVKAAKAGKSSKVQLRPRLVKKVVLVHGKRRVVYQRVAFTGQQMTVAPAIATVGDLAGLNRTTDPLELKSSVAYVIDQSSSQVLFEKNADAVLPIASITKLMTGLVVVEANQDMDEMLTIAEEDVDREKFSSSRLRVGVSLPRSVMLHLALMSSENRASAALGRNYPGGLPAFVAAMNAKAKALGMQDTRYVDANGLSSKNVSSARDLARLVVAAGQQPLLAKYSTDPRYAVEANGRTLNYVNTNHLVNNPEWDIGLQKTGYISEAGRCLVMQAKIEGRPVVMVFLDSKGKESRLGDASRVRKWLEEAKLRTML